MKTSTVVSVGHACTESGSGIVVIYLETERAGLSPRGARVIARQLLEWADHAETWQQTDQDKREQQWKSWKEEEVETVERWVAVKTTDDPEAE